MFVLDFIFDIFSSSKHSISVLSDHNTFAQSSSEIEMLSAKLQTGLYGGFPEQRDPASRMLCSQLLGDGPVAYSYSLSVHNLHPDILGNVLVLAMVQSLESGQIDCVSGRLSFMQVTSREGS